MAQNIVIAGYQGPRSILSRGLAAFAEDSLPSATLIHDVTADGLSAQSLFQGIETGKFKIGYMASGYLTHRVRELGLLDIPFSVSDRKAAYSQLDGWVGERLGMAVENAANLVVLAFWDNGFRHLTNGLRSLRSPEDCEGLRVRTLNNQLYQDTMASIGFEPLVTDVKELVSACETGRVHAQENPLTNMLTFNLDRWHKHVSLTGHIFGAVLLVANKQWYHSLAEGEKKTLLRGASRSTQLQRKLAEAEDTNGILTLVSRGVEILHPDEIDLHAFRLASREVRDKAIADLPRDLVQNYLQH